VGARNSAVAGEGVRATAGSCEGASTSEDLDTKDEEQEAEAACCGASDHLEQHSDWLSGGCGEQELDIRQDEENWHQVQDACESSSDHRHDHCFGYFASRVLDLLAHGSDKAVTSEGVSGL